MDPTIKDFESAIAELDTIIKTLEEGDLALEKSLELYERGVQLVPLLSLRSSKAPSGASRSSTSAAKSAPRRPRSAWTPTTGAK